MIEQVYAEALKQQRAQVRKLKDEQKRLQRERQHKRERIKELVAAIGQSDEPLTSLTGVLTELESTAGHIDGRLTEIRRELARLEKAGVAREDLAAALSLFGPVWEDLYPGERGNMVNLVIRQIAFEEHNGLVDMVLR